MSLEEMWERLAAHQPFADERGYGPAWARMCVEAAWGVEAAARPAWVADIAAWAAADAVAAWAWAEAAEAVRWIKRSEEQK